MLLAGPVKTIVRSPVTSKGRRLLIKSGVLESQVDLVSYLPHTVTVKPSCGYAFEDYAHLESLPEGFYYLISPRVGYNRTHGEINSPLSWVIDQDALSKSDFGVDNACMATFVNVFMQQRKQFYNEHGRSREMTASFGHFCDDTCPLVLIGPMSTLSKHHVACALEVLPHDWIHGLSWHGICRSDFLALFDEETNDSEEDSVNT